MSLRSRLGDRALNLVDRVKTRRHRKETDEGSSHATAAGGKSATGTSRLRVRIRRPKSDDVTVVFGSGDAQSTAHSWAHAATAEEFSYQMDTGLDPRGRVRRVWTVRATTGPLPCETTMYLIAADSARYHLSHVFRDRFEYQASEQTPSGEARELSWHDGVPVEAEHLLELLTRRIALPVEGLGHLNLILALDRYKIIDPTVRPDDWRNTKIGSAVNYLKYQKPWGLAYSREPEFKTLLDPLVEAIERHPKYYSTTTILSAPGSKGPGTSLAEALSAELARITGKTLVHASCPPHAPRKGLNPPDLAGLMSVDTVISGDCIVFDDVLHTGHTLNETARAASVAGATNVYGLVAAKTMRS